MSALFGRRWDGADAGPGRARRVPKGAADAAAAIEEVALDFSTRGVTILERLRGGEWCRFASAEADDPLFATVMEVLRGDVEKRAGRRPVRLLLPAEQVLRLEPVLTSRGTRARLAEAFAEASRATGLPPSELAVAVARGRRGERVPVLVTHAETCREAIAHARRWGFLPGPVSTRHLAEGFEAEPPVFQLFDEIGVPAADLPRAPQACGRRGTGGRLAIAVLVFLAALLVAAAVIGSRARASETDHPPAVAPAATPAPPTRPEARPGQAPPAASGAEAGPTASLPPPDRLRSPLPPRKPAKRTGPAAMAALAPAATPVPGPPRPVSRPTGPRPGPLAGRAAPASAPGPGGGDLALLGVMELGKRRQALVRDAAGAVHRIGPSESIAGWRVVEVGERQIVLARGAERRRLELFAP